MFKQSLRTGTNPTQDPDEHRQPLLGPEEHYQHEPHTLFTAGDDSDDDDLEGTSALVTPQTAKSAHSVTFSDEVQVRTIAPLLRSTTASRETRMKRLHLVPSASLFYVQNTTRTRTTSTMMP